MLAEMLLMVGVYQVVFAQRYIGDFDQEPSAMAQYSPDFAENEQVVIEMLQRVVAEHTVYAAIFEWEPGGIQVHAKISAGKLVDVYKALNPCLSATDMQPNR